jgi:hypothetical protein
MKRLITIGSSRFRGGRGLAIQGEGKDGDCLSVIENPAGQKRPCREFLKAIENRPRSKSLIPLKICP